MCDSQTADERTIWSKIEKNISENIQKTFSGLTRVNADPSNTVVRPPEKYCNGPTLSSTCFSDRASAVHGLGALRRRVHAINAKCHRFSQLNSEVQIPQVLTRQSIPRPASPRRGSLPSDELTRGSQILILKGRRAHSGRTPPVADRFLLFGSLAAVKF